MEKNLEDGIDDDDADVLQFVGSIVIVFCGIFKPDKHE